jgi:hypothetical protein
MGRGKPHPAIFSEIEHQAAGLGEDERLILQDRLNRAREMIGDVGALAHFLFWKSPDER